MNSKTCFLCKGEFRTNTGSNLCKECYETRPWSRKSALSNSQTIAEGVGKSYKTNEVTTTVRAFGGNGAHVTVPKDWIGKEVKVTILEDDKE